MAAGKKLVRILGRIVLVLIGLIVLQLIVTEIWTVALLAPAEQRLFALFKPEPVEEKLPSRVTITLDGRVAVYDKGTPAYTSMLKVLSGTRSPEAKEAADILLSEEKRPSRGKITVRTFGLPMSFDFPRSSRESDSFWLGIPHTNRGGYGYMKMYDDEKLRSLVQRDGV